MKLAAFNVMLNAAHETICKADAGEEVPSEALEWARNLVASNPKPKDARKRPVQDPILEMFLGDPMRYITRKGILAEFPAMPGWKADQHVKTMVDNGSLWPLAAGFRRRYFLSREARAAGAAHLELEKLSAIDEKKARRVARDKAKAETVEKKERKKKPEPKAITYSKKANRDMSIRGGRASAGEAIIPPGLVIQVCPGYEDRRFKVEGPIVGGFLSEFHSLRGMKGPA